MRPDASDGMFEDWAGLGFIDPAGEKRLRHGVQEMEDVPNRLCGESILVFHDVHWDWLSKAIPEWRQFGPIPVIDEPFGEALDIEGDVSQC